MRFNIRKIETVEGVPFSFLPCPGITFFYAKINERFYVYHLESGMLIGKGEPGQPPQCAIIETFRGYESVESIKQVVGNCLERWGRLNIHPEREKGEFE